MESRRNGWRFWKIQIAIKISNKNYRWSTIRFKITIHELVMIYKYFNRYVLFILLTVSNDLI